MNSLLGSGCIVEGRVLLALMLREIHTINGSRRLGYLWVLIQSVFGIGVFWAVRATIGASAPHGMAMPLFLVVGFVLWDIFAGCINRSMTAVDGNKALLTFPQVTVFDVMLARVLVITATEIVTGIVIVGVSVLVGYSIKPASIELLLFVLLMLPVFGFGMGMILASVAVFLPAIEKIVPMLIQALFFVSGVFFGSGAFNYKISQILLLNPVFQSIELMRSALHVSYPHDEFGPIYLACSSLIVFVVGGFLERFTRARRLSR